MGKTYDAITDDLRSWIDRQKMFFVATAPTDTNGHVNCSPKGHDSLRILDESTVVYRDLTGSGIETVAHLKDNGRIVIMFCAFEGAPKIVRLHGRGDVIDRDDPEFPDLEAAFGNADKTEQMGTRTFIKVHLSRISDSCGYSVPRYDYIADRDVLLKWCENKGADGVLTYQRENNSRSIDGLQGLEERS